MQPGAVMPRAGSVGWMSGWPLASGGRLGSPNSNKTHATGRGGAEGGVGWVDVGLAPGLGWAARIAKLGQDPCNGARWCRGRDRWGG
jgi:hypothetical protein